MSNQVGIVVVTYNRLQLLKEVIESLRAQTMKDYDIVIVNNGSTDDTPNWLEKQADIITITQENLGGAGGFHTGMKYVAEHGYEYCWVMDDDVVCNPTALEELIKAYNAVPEAGFVCSRVVGINGKPMNTPTALGAYKDGDYTDTFELVNEHQMVRVTTATFVSVLIKTNIIRSIGLPYKEFFIWGDDTEYTQRISNKYRCFVACKSEVLHKRRIQKSLSVYEETDENRLPNYFYQIRNSNFLKYRKLSKRAKLGMIRRGYKNAFNLWLKGDKTRAQILFRAYKSLLSFNPQINYPIS